MEIRKVLVTGAAGYIGRHVVKEFLNRGYHVIANDFNFKGVDERAEFSRVSIFSDSNNLYEELGNPDLIVHLAWRDGFIHNSDAHFSDLSAHMSFLKKMIDSGLPSLTVMGSMHEIGYWEGMITAETPCNPQSMYGISKNALRQALLLYSQNKSVVVHWLRGFYICGDDTNGSSIFAKILLAEEDGKELFPFNSGKNRYDFIDLHELVHQIVSASVQEQYTGIINVCSGKSMTLAEKVEEFIKEKNLNLRLDYGKFPDRSYDSPEVWGDATIINDIMEKENETI